MIAFITLCYSAIVWLIFFKLKLLPWNRSSQIAVFGIGVTGILGLLISMNLFQPYSTDVRVYERVVQIVPRVTGRVIDVPVKANTRVVKGDLLFRIDPRPFQYEVDRLTADVDLKKIVYEDATALAGALVAAEIKRDRAQAEFHAASAQLASARLDLAEATVYSPIDGWVTNLALAPGQIASQMASLPVMTVVGDQERVIIATFAQPALAFVKLGDAVEVAFDRLPGQTLDGRVQAIIPATGQGQLPPSGALMEWTTQPVPGRFGVRLELDEVHDDLVIPAGASGVAAVYSQHAQVIQIIRRVIIRMTSWLNYVIL
jgi:RND family efflux transporter MFP subunit